MLPAYDWSTIPLACPWLVDHSTRLPMIGQPFHSPAHDWSTIHSDDNAQSVGIIVLDRDWKIMSYIYGLKGHKMVLISPEYLPKRRKLLKFLRIRGLKWYDRDVPLGAELNVPPTYWPCLSAAIWYAHRWTATNEALHCYRLWTLPTNRRHS